MLMLRCTLPALVALSLVAGMEAQQKTDEAIRIYVAPPLVNPDGFVDADSKRIVDTRADFLRAIKDKAIEVVEASEQADVVLTILSSRYEGAGTEIETSPKLMGRGSTSRVEERERPKVRVMLKSGEYEREFANDNQAERLITWRVAAGEAANRIKGWIKENRARLLAKRSQQPAV